MVKRKKMTEQDKERAKQRKKIIAIFKAMGFDHIPTEGDHIWSESLKTMELDFVFLYENIIITYEFTGDKNPTDHFRGKVEKFDRINKNYEDFVKDLKGKYKGHFVKFDENGYFEHECRIFHIYHPYNPNHTPVSADVDLNANKIKMWDNSLLSYFDKCSKAIRKSARFEFFDYLGLKRTEVSPRENKDEGYTINALGIIPEEITGIGGSITVNFIMSPESLIECAYVLRKDGWRERTDLYQRLIYDTKIKEMRKYVSDGGSFIDSVTVSLPRDVKFYRAISDGNTFKKGEEITPNDFKKISNTLIQMEIPKEYNSLCIIDGQHRIYTYHEADGDYQHEINISKKRGLKNLLVTGLFFSDKTYEERVKIESGIFKTINSKRKSPPSSLLQSIESIGNPYGKIGLAKRVQMRLNKDGPLANLFVIREGDKKIKTASVVEYGLSRLVDINGSNVALYSLWNYDDKDIKKNLDKYVEYCAKNINVFFAALKMVFNDEWSPPPSKMHNTLVVTGSMLCFLDFLESDNKIKMKIGFFEEKDGTVVFLEDDISTDKKLKYYADGLTKLKKTGFSFNDSGFVSSQWKKLADKMSVGCWEGYETKYPTPKEDENQNVDQRDLHSDGTEDV